METLLLLASLLYGSVESLWNVMYSSSKLTQRLPRSSSLSCDADCDDCDVECDACDDDDRRTRSTRQVGKSEM